MQYAITKVNTNHDNINDRGFVFRLTTFLIAADVAKAGVNAGSEMLVSEDAGEE